MQDLTFIAITKKTNLNFSLIERQRTLIPDIIKIGDNHFSKQNYIFKTLSLCFGLNKTKIFKLMKALNIHVKSRFKDLDYTTYELFIKNLENFHIDSELRSNLKKHIDKIISSHSRHGYRLLRGLPVRGQRTHTNGRTQKTLTFPQKYMTKKKFNKR